ncbi:GMP synthase [glutamine-hydrolyzing] subunit A [Candidatus Norongarragalina meridionalis]|nr:GMP synthase [glutamine-hydrolyzing] subunit A [Candidatus Norongarragalina meridionalis]
MRVAVIDLGSQWTHRIWRTLRDLDCESEILPPDVSFSKVADADGLVLSGGAVRMGKGEDSKVSKCHALLDEFKKPVFGVCAGQQFIALHYGGSVAPAKMPEYGNTELTIIEPDDLFAGLPRKFTVWASHNDEVTKAPGFELLASSPDCKWHAFKHAKKPLYGTLFHPEVAHSQHGEEIYANFVKVCRR